MKERVVRERENSETKDDDGDGDGDRDGDGDDDGVDDGGDGVRGVRGPGKREPQEGT